MGWFDPKLYQGYNQIPEILQISQNVISQIRNQNVNFNNFYDIGSYYPECQDPKDIVKWNGLILYNVHTSTENRLEKREETNNLDHLIPIFDTITQKVKKLPGISEASINIYQPHSTIPRHVDNQWFLHNDNISEYRRCLSIIAGISMPSSDPELCSLTVGDETRGWNDGDFYGFDGLMPHYGYNKTDKIRITMLIETFADYWNVDQSKLVPVYESFSQY